MEHRFHVTAPRGAEDLLAAELTAIGVPSPRPRAGGVGFSGPLSMGYRACLWSRLASRVLLEIGELAAGDGDALYRAASAIDWTSHLRRGASLAIAATGTPAAGGGIDNTHFAALRVKDAIVDQLRACWGERPNVDLDRPDLRLRLHLRGESARLSVDLSGEGLHRRGYRVASVAAPLRENLAAAVLLRAGWAAQLEDGTARICLDPMCGSGTLLIEAAWIAGDVAPGLSREDWGFAGWAGHDHEGAALWRGLVADATARREAGRARLAALRFIGYDAEAAAVRAALACVEAAGLRGVVHVERRALSDVAAPPDMEGEAGLLVCNPPWGERLGQRRELESLYAALGASLRAGFVGWEAVVLTGDPGLGRFLGIHAGRRNVLHDGPIACQVLRMSIPKVDGTEGRGVVGSENQSEVRPRSEGAVAFVNRVAKNRKKLASWLRKSGVSCYRIYDADIPEYNFAIDLYQTLASDGSPGQVHAHVQEYAAPSTIEPAVARRRRGEALAMIREELGLPREQVHLERRERQRGSSQYEKRGEEGREWIVAEGRAKLWVNFDDYLDTGLFLDHRPLRLELSAVDSPAAGKRVLNLFCYTGAFTVHAALGGARSTTSVDLSRTYLEWAKRNLALNGVTAVGPDEVARRAAHQLIREDVLEWLGMQGALRWDLILCDPPSFSNSKRMRHELDVQRDHVELIRRCASLLSRDGLLIFSTNKRRFELDMDGLGGLRVEPHRASVPPDFVRSPGIHRAWLIRRG